MMGTLVEVVWRTTGEGTGAEAVRSTLDRMEALSSRMSLYSPASELVEINAAAGKAPVKVSLELLDVIEKSLTLSRMTGGAFDATVGSVEAVWGDIQREGGGRLPGEEDVRDALDWVGYERVRVDREMKTVFLEKEGMRLDLGGIAKGYIVDQAMAWLNGRGLQDALINAGGDIRVSGTDESPPWRIGVQDPFEKGRLLGFFSLQQGAVVTSGTYERYFEGEGKRFAHIIDPATGRPVEGLVSATVITEESFMADALATAVMVKGRQEGIAMLGRFPGARAVFVERDGTIWVAEDLKDVLELAPLPSRNAVRFYGTPVSFLSRPPQNAHLRRTNYVRLVMTWTPAFAGASFVRLAPGRF
jgi:thiamine biosynthesis lipoprotein